MAKERLNTGGLMRCCVATWNQHNEAGLLTGKESLGCKYCASGMQRNNDGVWEWNREYESKRNNEENSKEGNKKVKYRVKCWIATESEENTEPYSRKEAEADLRQAMFLQPENKYELQAFIDDEWTSISLT